jgi:manganese/zinc/iron transport system permease protein
VTAVASFEAVGNILVVAMFVVPPAAAYMLTDRLSHMIAMSTVLAVVSAVSGHIGALVVPAWFGFQSTTTSGMMAVSAGVILLLAVAFGPRHGVVVKFARRQLLSWRILADDVIALLYRIGERGRTTRANVDHLQDILLADRLSLRTVLCWLHLRGEVIAADDEYLLTMSGEEHARALVRSHRLWEQYLVSEADYAPDRIHDKAEQFEHFTDRVLRDELEAATDAPAIDPHGSKIPPERDA